MKAKLSTDGGSRGNPGPAAFGYVLETADGHVLAAHGESIGRATNNVAEYRGLLAGMAKAAELDIDELEVVSDWERSNAFYRDVLGAEIIRRGDGYAYRFGDQQLNVHGPGVSASIVAADPVRPGNSDLCFVWPGSAEEAAAYLRDCGVEVELGPTEKPGARGAGTSVYFRDPDGTLLELIAYD